MSKQKEKPPEKVACTTCSSSAKDTGITNGELYGATTMPAQDDNSYEDSKGKKKGTVTLIEPPRGKVKGDLINPKANPNQSSLTDHETQNKDNDGIANRDSISENGTAAVSENESAGRASETNIINVHKLTHRPHLVWDILNRKIGVVEVKALSYEAERPDNCIRFVCLSDTHSKVERCRTINFIDSVPDGDVLLHAGDFTLRGEIEECVAFNKFLGELRHPIKLVIPGNHEIMLDPELPGRSRFALRKELKLSLNPAHYNDKSEVAAVRKILNNATLLLDSQVEICGIKIYGCPWVPSYGYPGFGCDRGQQLLDKYNKIPDDINILMSHGPPLGFGDLTMSKNHVGCVELLNTVRHRIKPKYVVSGHIHEGHGILSDGTTTYINACVCTKTYKPAQKAIIFDYPLPPPFTREDFLKLNQSDCVPWEANE